jgi:hypothetical protein
MAFRDEEPEDLKAAALLCSRCERMCEPQELQVCSTCRKKFCNACHYRVGGRDYCNRACGDVFFFGGDVGEDEEIQED